VPRDPDDAGERDPKSSLPCTIYFEPRIPRPALLQLKLCNRQLHVEACEAIARHVPYDSGPAHLDLMVKGSSIWPTWRSLPVTPNLSPVIDVSLRIFEATGWGSEFSTGVSRALWNFFRLLVVHGPCLIHNHGLKHPLNISRLRFDIVLCFPTSVDDIFGTYRDVFSRLERLAFDKVGMGHIGTIEACLGADRRIWKLR